MSFAEGVLDHHRVRIVGQIGRPDRDLSVAAGHVEHIGRLGEARETAAQGLYQCLAVVDGDAEVSGAAHKIGMMQVVGFHSRGHQRAHQLLQGFHVVVHAAQQHGLATQRDPGLRQTIERGNRRRRQLVRMMGTEVTLIDSWALSKKRSISQP